MLFDDCYYCSRSLLYVNKFKQTICLHCEIDRKWCKGWVLAVNWTTVMSWYVKYIWVSWSVGKYQIGYSTEYWSSWNIGYRFRNISNRLINGSTLNTRYLFHPDLYHWALAKPETKTLSMFDKTSFYVMDCHRRRGIKILTNLIDFIYMLKVDNVFILM